MPSNFDSDKFQISINGKEIRKKADLGLDGLSDKVRLILTMKLLDIAQVTADQKIMESLGHKEVNMLLMAELSKCNRKRAVSDTLLQFYQNMSAAAGADYLLFPDPIDIHGTKDKHGLDFRVAVNEIVAIESAGRVKKIHLTKPLLASDGEKHTIIQVNDNKVSFKSLMEKIQGKYKWLFQVNKSIVLSVMHYDLVKGPAFLLRKEIPSLKAEKLLRKIRTDSTFNQEDFDKWMRLFARLYNIHMDFAENLRQAQRLQRYIKDNDVTF